MHKPRKITTPLDDFTNDAESTATSMMMNTSVINHMDCDTTIKTCNETVCKDNKDTLAEEDLLNG